MSADANEIDWLKGVGRGLRFLRRLSSEMMHHRASLSATGGGMICVFLTSTIKLWSLTSRRLSRKFNNQIHQ